MHRDTLLIRIFPKVMATVLVLTLLMPLVPAASAVESGSCGDHLNWSFADGTLTITGRGGMEDYDKPEEVPWHEFRERIFWLRLPDGLTHVGSLAFYGCSSITAVTIPESVETIGDMAFMKCSSMEILSLPSGLESIGNSAFELCSALQDLRLPGSLKVLSKHAFYRCTSLRSVTVPSSVTEMGMGVFSYCESLIRASVQAKLSKLPIWTFYGCTSLTSIELAAEIKSVGQYCVYNCESLSVIYYGGEPGDAEELRAQISGNNDYFRDNGVIEDVLPEESETYTETEEDESGNVVVKESTTTETENSTITTTTTENTAAGETEQEITATIVTEEGWEELVEAIDDAMNPDGVDVEVYISNGTEVPPEVVEALTGHNIWMEVITSVGGSFTMDFLNMDNVDFRKPLDLSYTLTLAEKIKYDQLQGFVVYELAFDKSSQVPVGVAIQLPMENARQTASLYQVRGGKLEHLQSAVVDQKGVVHFYLATVDKGTTYFIGINIAGINTSDAYIPQSLEGEYGITEQIQDVDYVITGRKSSWGLNFLEVNEIMIGFMLSTAAIVGLLMYALNKRKLRRGMTPGWEDDESET